MNTQLTNEAAFFKDIAPRLLQHVAESLETNTISVQKGLRGDFATDIDISVERIIVGEIQRLFPGDEVLAEEESSDTEIGDGRIWIIDPICGTNNIGRDIDLYCSNIALAEKGELIASCVVDFNKKEFYWSVGGGIVNKGAELFIVEQTADRGILMDIDHGSVIKYDFEAKKRYSRFLEKVITETDYMLCSYNTSLTFMNVAVGKTDVALLTGGNPWDVCASVFLVQQMGGVVTDLDGSEWDITTKGMIISLDKDLHREILAMYTATA